MEQQLEKALAEIIEKASRGIDSSAEFITGQIPDVVQQLLSWKLTESCIGGFTSLLVTILCVTFLSIGARKYQDGVKKKESNWAHGGGLYSTPTGVLIIGTSVSLIVPLFSLFIMYSSVIDAAKIILAPKLYLIEYAAQLVK